jgi:hypothetical protein
MAGTVHVLDEPGKYDVGRGWVVQLNIVKRSDDVVARYIFDNQQDNVEYAGNQLHDFQLMNAKLKDDKRSHARVKGKFNDALDAAYQVIRLEKDRILSQEWKVKLKDGE